LTVAPETSLADVLARVHARRDQAVTDLTEFLRIPSISADPAHANDVSTCASWLAARFSAVGLSAKVEPTPGHPIVLARNEHHAGRPTVLLYGHYDVQPVDPIDQWTTPPFEPSVRKTAANTDAIYARGAADDKGQIWAHVEAISAWQSAGGLPINLIAVIEGEEEIDSHHLASFITRYRDMLHADIAVISDTNCFARGVPAITTGLRGLVYSQVTIRAAAHDLHSGIHGGAVRNPAIALARLLSRLHNDDGHVTIPSFYDGVIASSATECDTWATLPFSESEYATNLGLAEGITTLSGESGFTTLERRWSRPTCDVCGLTSGYQGAGAKTIIPASATAKVSFRLVPGQNPQVIRDAFKKFVFQNLPPGFEVDVINFAAAPAVSVPTTGPWVRAASAAVEHGFGIPPVLVRDGLTIPVVNLLRRELGIDTLLLGFGLPDDRPHAPDEKFDLESLRAGARTAAALYNLIAEPADLDPKRSKP
jgi:acetylornithine deacetylase/succinyl-diaminopimelate desuccinylase-like protein